MTNGKSFVVSQTTPEYHCKIEQYDDLNHQELRKAFEDHLKISNSMFDYLMYHNLYFDFIDFHRKGGFNG